MFVEFLKEKNAYVKFMARAQQFCTLKRETLDQFFKYCPKENYLSRAFNWATTPEGGQYWDEINQQWQRILKGEKRNETFSSDG